MCRPTTDPTESNRGGGQAGSSLIEVLVAMGVMALVLMGIVAGYEMTAKASASAKDRSGAEAALTAVGERVQSIAYRPCGSLTQVRQDFAAITRPTGYQADLESVSYLRSTADVGSSSGLFGSACTADHGAQLLTIVITDTRNSALTARGQIVLRNPLAAP